jgi:membrane protein DedA with SNARE-associated domain
MFNEAELSKKILDFANTYEAWLGPLVFILAFGESIAFVSLVLPFWGILVTLGAVLGAAGGFQSWTILIAAAVGAALGDWVSYWLGKHYDKQIRAMWPIRNYPGMMERGEKIFHDWGAWAIVIGRFSGPLRASVPIIAGAVKMNWHVFQIANWTSAFLWSAVLITFGDIIGKTMSKLFGGG